MSYRDKAVPRQSLVVLKISCAGWVSCELCESFKNTYFLEDLQIAGYEIPVRGSFINKVASLTA